MSELVSIPTSIFEYVAEFDQPILALWLNRAEIVQAVFDALNPWKASIDNIDPKNDGKPADQGFLIRLPNERVTFFFGPAKCKFTKDSADWSQAQAIIEILDAARTAFLKATGASIKVQKTAIALHMQPKTKSFRDILMPFLPPQLIGLHTTPVRTGATIIRWERTGVTLDGSGLIANGVFVQIDRDFDGDVGYEQIAEQLHTDEDSVLALLGVEEEQL
jgi:hypothetical protein